jgi:methyl-accepting chemotaxis protein
MQMDELTQQNAALVEQATAASQGMTTEAGGLNEMMARYDFTGVTNGSNGTHYATLHASLTSDTKGTDAATDKKPATTSTPAPAERRKANRPWAAQPTRSQPSAAPRPEAAVAPATRATVRAESGKDNSEWQEF